MSSPIVIAIDGTSASGKSTNSKLVAKALGFLHVDTGAMYRAVALKATRQGVSVDDETGEKLLKLMDLLNEHDDVQNVYANFEISDALVARMGG